MAHATTLDTAALASIPLATLRGEPTTLAPYAHAAKLIVNVASRCGLTPQYEQLERLQRGYGDRGFTVLGFPSNQFLQEPGGPEAIEEYCSTTWGVTFPMFQKVRVNGRHRHPLYAMLTRFPDDEGKAGKVGWNFEKFLVAPDGRVARFRPHTSPDDPRVIAAIEAVLPDD